MLCCAGQERQVDVLLIVLDFVLLRVALASAEEAAAHKAAWTGVAIARVAGPSKSDAAVVLFSE